jgi:RimJ/RimL family protein N-acetyltransferase/GNAT superfamily N-acetyltransferase
MEIKHVAHPPNEIIPLFKKHWESTIIARLGECIDLMSCPALIAFSHQPSGVLSFRLHNKELEILSLFSESPGTGIGSALLDQIEAFAQAEEIHEIFLVTTNDNINALKFYQQRGYALRALRPNAVQYSRLHKPEIPAETDGIPIRDELLLSKGIRVQLDHFYQEEMFHVKHGIILQPFDTIAYSDIIKLFSDPKVLRYQAMSPIENETDAKTYFIRVCLGIQQEKRLIRGIFVEGRFAGLISLHQIQNNQCNLGYSLMPEYWNQGIATEAAITMIRLAFERLHIRRIQAITHPDNIASIRLLERLRFHQEGTMIDYIQNPRNNLYENREFHALLRKNFK